MDVPSLKPGGREGALRRQVVDTGLFDGDDEIAEVVVRNGLPQCGDGLLEALPRRFDGDGFHEDAAVKIGEHPLGTCLGTIDGHDAEVLRGGLLDPRMERAGRLDNRTGARGATASPAPDYSSHANTSWGWEERCPKPTG
jgi:hypothetical protein